MTIEGSSNTAVIDHENLLLEYETLRDLESRKSDYHVCGLESMTNTESKGVGGQSRKSTKKVPNQILYPTLPLPR